MRNLAGSLVFYDLQQQDLEVPLIPATSTPLHPTGVSTAGTSSGQASVYLRRLLQITILVFAVVLLATDFAEARRFGGGRSFGSRRSYSNNYSKRVSPQRSTTSDQRKATPTQGPSRRGGLLGGLLMGGLLGSLFFGGGFGGGFGLLELLLLGFVGYMIFKVMRSRRAAAEAGAGGDRFTHARAPGGPASSRGRDSWDALRSTPPPHQQTEPAGPAMPDGINEAEFLDGAKALYARLQSSWDRRDLDDIRSFTSAAVFSEIAHQAQMDPTPGKTDILMIEARVLETRTEGSETIISVLFDALLREDAAADHPEQVREVWHIQRDNTATSPEWKLEGIQQLEI